MVLAMACFAIEDMFIKLAASTVPVGEILIVVGICGALIYGGWAALRGQAPVHWRMLRGPSGLRALFEGIAGLSFVSALALAPLSIITTIMQASPLLVTLGAALFLAEPVGWRRWSAICVGLGGVMIVLRPWGEALDIGVIFAIFGVVAMSARDLATRKIRTDISTAQLSTIGFLAVIPGGVISLYLAGDAMILPDPHSAILLACTVVIGIPGIYFIIAAMRVGEISFVAPFRYSRIIFGLLVGFLIFDEALDGYTLLGAGIITVSGLYTFAREARLRRRTLSNTPVTG